MPDLHAWFEAITRWWIEADATRRNVVPNEFFEALAMASHADAHVLLIGLLDAFPAGWFGDADQPDYRTAIPETRIGFGRRGRSLRDIVLCVDQSGSMAPSVVYASVFAAVLASIKAVNTSVVVFDTSVVDLTPLLWNAVDVLFGTQLGGAPISTTRSLIARDW